MSKQVLALVITAAVCVTILVSVVVGAVILDDGDAGSDCTRSEMDWYGNC